MICTVALGAENEVAATVGNEMSFVHLEFLENKWVIAEHEVGALNQWHNGQVRSGKTLATVNSSTPKWKETTMISTWGRTLSIAAFTKSAYPGVVPGQRAEVKNSNCVFVLRQQVCGNSL